MKKIILIAFIFLVNLAFAQNMITKVIPLTYVQANSVIQLIKPLLNPGEQVSGSGQTLIVKVAPDTMTQLRTVIHQLDVPPVTFKVAIYQGDPNWLSAQNNNSIVYSTQPQSEVQRSQSVTVLSGGSAFISTAQQVPIVTSVSAGWNPGVSYKQHNIENGLVVHPLLQGSQVKLTVSRVRQQMNAAGGQQFDNQQVDTIVMAPLNKWVALGTAEGTNNAAPSDTVYSAGRSFSQNSTLYIKVTVLKAMPQGATK